jgi:hypothetical protein
MPGSFLSSIALYSVNSCMHSQWRRIRTKKKCGFRKNSSSSPVDILFSYHGLDLRLVDPPKEVESQTEGCYLGDEE